LSSRKKTNLFLLLAFIVITAAILTIGSRYKDDKINESVFKQYNALASNLSTEVATLIEEKKNATLALGITFAQSERLRHALSSHDEARNVLNTFSKKLRDETDFKNVWVQMIDKDGNNVSRSWSDRYGDNLALIRADVRSMLNKPEARTSISVGRFDMSFKAMVPIHDESGRFIGFIEVITHFNSIAEKIKEKGFEPVILVDKKYKEQIVFPFTGLFCGDYYVANKNADRTLVDYIAKEGVTRFVSPNRNYMIDDARGSFVVNYTLLDGDYKPMANILMFKALSNLDFGSIEGIRSTVTLLMLLSILSTGFLLYLLSSRKAAPSESGSKHALFLLFSALFILVSLLYYFLLDWNYTLKRESYLKTYNNNTLKDYSIIHDKFRTIAETMFERTINTPEVLNLVHDAYGSPEQKAAARKALFALLGDAYEFYKRYDLRQLHFHLRNNESFLRFHRPEKYGDDLTGVRSTVEWVNANQARIEGFEEGRIYNGFRYVFPLSWLSAEGNREHVGSVEISFSAYAIAHAFAVSHDTRSGFLVNAGVVDAKVFHDEHSNYTASEFPGFYYEHTIKQQLEHTFQHIDTTLIAPAVFEEISARIHTGEVFSIPSDKGYVLFTFIPVKNPVSGKVVAALILQVDDMVLATQRNHYLMLLLAGFTLIFVVFLYIYKEVTTKRTFQQLSVKTQQILDAQQAIVIVTDGQRIIDANKRFLDFFGFDSLDAFRDAHSCICEYFDRDDKFFHLGKVPEGQNWVTTMEHLPYRDHIVSIADLQGRHHAYAVSLNAFDNNYIISLSDISDTMSEHFSLSRRITLDKLTGAYNREYFDNNIDTWLHESLYKKVHLGVIIFDIDHFKRINDTYGHNRGDSVLIQLCRIVRETVRQDDTLIRWGGEEFLIIAKTDTLKHLERIAENIRKRIAMERFEEIGTITCSFGATLHCHKETTQQTIERADKALYRAKNEGRNRVVAQAIEHPDL